jgi:APA family basic amino acid/polyamine antiporter
VLVLRRTRPELPRGFRVPAAPVVALLSVLACVYLMLNLIGETWVRFVIWLAIGFVIYFGYGRRHSRLAAREREAPARQPIA